MGRVERGEHVNLKQNQKTEFAFPITCSPCSTRLFLPFLFPHLAEKSRQGTGRRGLGLSLPQSYFPGAATGLDSLFEGDGHAVGVGGDGNRGID